MSCTCERGQGTHSECPVHGRGAPPAAPQADTPRFPGLLTKLDAFALHSDDATDRATFAQAAEAIRMLQVPLGEDTNIPHRPGYVAAQPVGSEPGLEELIADIQKILRESYLGGGEPPGRLLDDEEVSAFVRAAAALAEIGQLRQQVEELRKTRDGWFTRCELAEAAERIATERLLLSSQLNGRIMQDEACIQVALECAEAEAKSRRSHCEAAVRVLLSYRQSHDEAGRLSGAPADYVCRCKLCVSGRAVEALAAHSEPAGKEQT